MTININELNKRISPAIRHLIAVKNRDYLDAALMGIQNKDSFDLSVECFNNAYINREPDTIGVTMSYPKGAPKTHVITRFFPITLGEIEMTKQITALENDLVWKIPLNNDEPAVVDGDVTIEMGLAERSLRNGLSINNNNIDRLGNDNANKA